MVFLNLGALFGLGALSIPLIIHLLNRFQVKRTPWAAMRFLIESLEKKRRQLMLEDIILLILRCLLIALLIFALSRPMWLSGPGSSGPHVTRAVIILDDSMSMGLMDGTETRFQTAKTAEEQVLDALPGGSTSALFYAADGVEPIVPAPTDDFNLLRLRIRQAKLTGRSTNLSIALQSAVETLQRDKLNGARDIYLITDGQANGWPNLDSIQSELAEIKKQISLHIVIIGGLKVGNLAVTGLRVETGLTPANQPLRFSVDVTNDGDSDSLNIPVSLFVDDSKVASDEATFENIPAKNTRTTTLYAKLPSEGFHTVTAQIPGDKLPMDDQRSLALRALHEAKVLLVNGTEAASAKDSDDFFLRNALAPVPRAELDRYFIKTTTIPVTKLGDIPLNDFSAVFLSNIASMSDDQLAKLTDYVTEGGGLVVFPGPQSNLDWYNQKLAGAMGLLPAKLGPNRGDATQKEKYFLLQDRDYEHPIVSLWNDAAAGTLSTAHFFSYDVLTPVPWKAPKANDAPALVGQPHVVLNFAVTQTPAAVEQTYGMGRVILFASTGTTAWNDLPIHQAFVPLIQRTLGSLLERQNAGLNIRVGQPFLFSVKSEDLDKEVTVTTPDKQEAPHLTGIVQLVDRVPTVGFRETELSGAYRVSLQDSANPIFFAAQADPAESDLTPLSDAQIKTLSQSAEVIRWGSGVSLVPKISSAPTGKEYAMDILTAALLVAVLEMVLSQYFSLSK